MRRIGKFLQGRYWSHLVVTWVMVAVLAKRWSEGAPLGREVVPLAVIAGCAWALHARYDIGRDITIGFHAQQQTWNLHLSTLAPLNPSPPYGQLLHRMRETEHYLHTAVRRHRVQRLTIAFPDPIGYGLPHEAASLRQGRRAHLWVGTNWLGPEDSEHLPVILEHELGHIQRRDNQRITALQALLILLAILSTAWLTPLAALLSITALRLLHVAWSWKSELACDDRAVRQCGRDAAIAFWQRCALSQPARPLSGLPRLRNSLRSALSHPPDRLRLWRARRIQGPDGDRSHPLAVRLASPPRPPQPFTAPEPD
ncbi:hypothetical protein ABT160_29960 [Streptomyces sp. NPDC001941]|uniref:hypothetical protein n=1 Tax=Streptomyces sp. NPDC001941 TaxID=3154659 RepID=UPI0033203727